MLEEDEKGKEERFGIGKRKEEILREEKNLIKK